MAIHETPNHFVQTLIWTSVVIFASGSAANNLLNAIEFSDRKLRFIVPSMDLEEKREHAAFPVV